MAYWLVKTEPEAWSWGDQLRAGISQWDSVRNYQAANFLKEMRLGELAFFYHSGKEKRIVGIVEVVRENYPDPSAAHLKGFFVMVDFKTKMTLPKPVSLSDIRNDLFLKDTLLLKQPRLSVIPLESKAWQKICSLGEV